VSTAPVAVFDSGIGGLSVAREIRRALPAEDLLYYADTANVPYGDRPSEWVRERSLAIGRWLQAQGAKTLVVACNTASGAALEALREALSIPVIGLEPAVKPAVRDSVNKRVGVMATTVTLASARYARLVEAYGDGATVLAQPCPGLVDLIEGGHLDDPALHTLLHRFALPLREAGVDTVVLGCTHYVFVQDPIQEALGPQVRLVDSGPAIARQTERVLRERDALAVGRRGETRVLTSAGEDEQAAVTAVVARLWGEPLPVERVDL
jgi:glutamate racemase